MKLFQECIHFMSLTFQYEKVYQLSSETREDFLNWDREWEKEQKAAEAEEKNAEHKIK